MWNIKAVTEQLGPEICSHIIFLHAVLGCDTIPHTCWHWKGHFSQILQIKVREQANVFATESATPKEISTAGVAYQQCAVGALDEGSPGTGPKITFPATRFMKDTCMTDGLPY